MQECGSAEEEGGMQRLRVVICMPSMTVDGHITLARGHSSDEEAGQSLIPPSARAVSETIQQIVSPEATLHGSGSFVILPARKPEVPFPPNRTARSRLAGLNRQAMEPHEGSSRVVQWTFKPSSAVCS